VGVVIDSSVLVAADRGELDLDAILASHGGDEVVIAAITAAELLHGVHRMTGARRARAERFVETICDTIEVVPFDLEIARTHAALAADLRARGISVGAHDLMIAATAVAREYAVATRHLRSLPRIDGIQLVRW
jgi:predicted nucleic acid-binding protein